jgi:hypothetical protein
MCNDDLTQPLMRLCIGQRTLATAGLSLRKIPLK